MQFVIKSQMLCHMTRYTLCVNIKKVWYPPKHDDYMQKAPRKNATKTCQTHYSRTRQIYGIYLEAKQSFWASKLKP